MLAQRVSDNTVDHYAATGLCTSTRSMLLTLARVDARETDGAAAIKR
jgi:hypothetical protein